MAVNTRTNSPFPDDIRQQPGTQTATAPPVTSDPFDRVPRQDGVQLDQNFDQAPEYDSYRTDRLTDPNDPMYYGNQTYQDRANLPDNYYNLEAGKTLFENQDMLPWQNGMATAGQATASTVSPGSIPQVEAAQATADQWQSVNGQVAPEETVEFRLNNLIDKNNDYMLRAKTMGMQYANERGLLNSSMGAGAAQASAIDAALKIASQDAQAFREQAKINQGFANEAAKSNAELATNVSMKNSELATQARIANAQNNAQILMKNAELLTQTSIKNAELVTQTNIANSEQAAAITQTYIRELSAIDMARMSNESQRMIADVQDQTRRYEARLADQEKRWQVSAEIGAAFDLTGYKETQENYRHLVNAKTQLRIAEADSKVKMYSVNVDSATRVAIQDSQAAIQHNHDLITKYSNENDNNTRAYISQLDYKKAMDQQAAVNYASLNQTFTKGMIDIFNNENLTPEQRDAAITNLNKIYGTSLRTEDMFRLQPVDFPGYGSAAGSGGTGGTGPNEAYPANPDNQNNPPPAGGTGSGTGDGTWLDAGKPQEPTVIEIEPGTVVTSPSGKKAMILESAPITSGPYAGQYMVTTADGGTYYAKDPNNPDTWKRATQGFGFDGGRQATYPGSGYNPGGDAGLLRNIANERETSAWANYSG